MFGFKSVCFVLLLLSCSAISVSSARASSFVVGGLNAAAGGFESLAPGEDSALANDISTAFPGTTFQFTGTLTPAFLSGVNVVIMGDATTDSSAIAPLSASAQTALFNFVLGGGTAILFSDNSTFDPNAPAVNASLVSPFGVTAAGTLSGGVAAPILNLTGPLTGPFTPVTSFTTNYPGYYTNTGGGTVLAEFNNNPSEAAIDYFAPGFFGPGSGAVVLFSDSNAMIAGDALTTTNLNVVLNALALTGTTATAAPEPGTLTLFGAAAGLLAVMSRKRAWPAK